MRRPLLAGAGLIFLIIVVIAASASARAQQQQQRPSEEEIFGSPRTPPAAPEQAPPVPADGGVLQPVAPTPRTPLEEPGFVQSPSPTHGGPPAAGSARDQAILGNPELAAELSTTAAPENPLAIGAMIYLRAQTSILEDTSPYYDSLSVPNLVDVYLDGRPNDRVRGFVLGRMIFDPTAPPATVGSNNNTGANAEYANTPGIAGFQTTRGPQALLDQVWIKFDLQHRVFVTAGKQHFRWGTGRFWNPTDYLHPIKRNPLSPFDARLGLTMLKLHLPWESRGWNFYGVVVFEDPNGPSNTLGGASAGGRAEVVLGAAEIGVDGLFRRGEKPRLGLDVSAGVWDFDFYTDIAVRWRRDFPIWSVDNSSGTPIPFVDQLPAGPIGGARNILPQVVLGMTYARRYGANDIITFGGEYFYNSAGYHDESLYPIAVFGPSVPALAAVNPVIPVFQPFYLGRHYGGVFVNIPGPYSWNYHTFNFSGLGNFSDLSFVVRLDYSLLMLTHLTFEAYIQGHFGTKGGEFRFAVDPNALVRDFPILTGREFNFNPAQIPSIPAPLVDLGVALRVRI